MGKTRQKLLKAHWEQHHNQMNEVEKIIMLFKIKADTDTLIGSEGSYKKSEK